MCYSKARPFIKGRLFERERLWRHLVNDPLVPSFYSLENAGINRKY